MCATHGVSNPWAPRGPDGSCPKGFARSAFDRWVSGHVCRGNDLELCAIKSIAYLGHYPSHQRHHRLHNHQPCENSRTFPEEGRTRENSGLI